MMTDPASPEIAELRSEHYNAVVTGLRRVHEDLLVLHVRPDTGVSAHAGGQFTLIGLGVWEPLADGCVDRVSGPTSPTKLVKRAYSLSSSFFGPDGRLLQSGDEDRLEFYIALVRDDDPRVPSLTGRLFALEPGARLWVHEAIFGDYTLEGVDTEDAVLFLATGTGEAPHNAMLLELARRGHAGPVASVVSVRERRDLGYQREQHLLEEEWAGYRYVPLVTREPGQPSEHIQDLLRSESLGERIGFPLDPARTHVFVCGNPRMVGAPRRDSGGGLTYPVEGGVIEILAKRGFRPDVRGRRGNLHFEAFW